VDVVYWSSHFSAPLNLEYYFSTKSRFKPFVSIGGLFQNHLSTTLSYNIRTLSQEAYLIEKKILDRHWNSFLTFGVGLDLPLYQRILGFANVSIRKAVGGQFLLTNEKLVTNGTVGVKYKF
jgi:outer membrane protein W